MRFICRARHLDRIVDLQIKQEYFIQTKVHKSLPVCMTVFFYNCFINVRTIESVAWSKEI